MKKIILFLLTINSLTIMAQNKVKLQWLGHAAFYIESPNGTKILIDPWITKNPNTPENLKNLDLYHPDVIIVSHSHADHVGDALTIAKSKNVKIISARMTAVYSEKELPESLQTIINVGGMIEIGDVKISAVPAMHSSDFGGRPIGIILQFSNGETIYHTGDTWIFGDMALIEEFYKPSIILLTVGGGAFVQDTKTAKAVIKKYFKPKTIIPMHYGEEPFKLASEDEVIEIFKDDKRVLIMKPGETKIF